ncbi:hypothetical protein, partial [Thiolapillus sp.]|uniref:hypothetical protein n=1 Tax=Thiolapillus sp. TaxID=2017437 RepID=UPI003AF9CEA2
FSYAYFVFPLRYRTPDKQCGPGRYRGLTAFASLSMAVSGRFLPAFRRQGYAADALKMKETENCIVPFPT